MIDNPLQAANLLTRLKESLPIPPNATPEILVAMRQKVPNADVVRQCQITWVTYADDQGGIVCKLAFEGDTAKHEFFVSITHLRFDCTTPLSREIFAYQKHRIKRMRRLGTHNHGQPGG